MASDETARLRSGAGPLLRFVERATQAVRRLPRAALDLAFPPECAACGRELTSELAKGEAPFCSACWDEFDLLGAFACPRCAAPLPITRQKPSSEDEEGEVDCQPPAWAQARPCDCVRCRGRRYWFHGAVAAGRYTGRLRSLVLQMKRNEQNWIALAMGQLVWHCRGPQLAKAGIDLVVPIPLHWRRRLTYGTNSAALLGEVLASRLGVPLAPRLLRRRRHTRPQFSLSPNERRTNVRGAFVVRTRRRLANAHVLLVDDIMTSGATCNEAARVLRQAGAKRVTVVVAARAVPS